MFLTLHAPPRSAALNSPSCALFVSREYCLAVESISVQELQQFPVRRRNLLRLCLMRWIILSAALACCGFVCRSVHASSSDARQVTAREAAAPVTHYTLPPDKLQKAVALARTGRRIYFGEYFTVLIVLLVILRVGWAAKLSDWATRAISLRIVQALIFCPALLLTIDLAQFPFRVWGHAALRAYGLSVQGWLSWLGDWAKEEAITLVIATFVGWLLYLLIRRSPRRWWMAAWGAAMIFIVAGFYFEPLVVDPMFYDYRPLAETHPQLVTSVEEAISRVGVTVPESCIYEMLASKKVNELNAYVAGVGGTKRIVFWDTLLESMGEPQTLSVFGHELGHYVLGHAWKTIAASALGLGISLPILAWFFNGILRKWESLWYVREPRDWTALAVLLLLIFVFQFVATPIDNAFSRYIEHQADVFGLEVIHGIVPDSPQVAAQALQTLGETNLEEPDPSPAVVFWFYTHPPIADRINFALSYDPWKNGGSPEFVH